ncbi:MAG: DUF305 domain-containing protein [Actinomycetota bacterium]|nr:DUF305 domain-containing protein [Actinomycetota bacterium]
MSSTPRSTGRLAAPAVGLAAALLLAACGGTATTSGAADSGSPAPAASSAPGGHGAGAASNSAPAHGAAAASPSASPASPASPGSAGSSASSTGSPAAAAHNAQDVSFAQDMIPHHASAIAMAKLAESRAGSAEVKELAERIEAAQDPEIQTMTGWLRSWSEKVPDTSAAMGHAEMGHDMPGMEDMGMNPDEMRKLKAARGAKFDRMFLEMMTRHHQGALDMAEQEQATGQFPAAKELARSIADSQTAEIEEMRQLLEQL